MSNRDNRHQIGQGFNQNTTEVQQRRCPFNSRRTRKKIRRPLGGGGPPPPGPPPPGWAAAARRRRTARGAGGRWAAGGPPARANIATNKHHHRRTKSKRRSHSVHEPQKEPLSFRKSSFSYVYLSAAAILCDHFLSLVKNFQTKTKIFEVSRFLLLLLCCQKFKKYRDGTKIGYSVWPPPINRRKSRKDSAFHSGRVPLLLWCRLCQTATIIIW